MSTNFNAHTSSVAPSSGVSGVSRHRVYALQDEAVSDSMFRTLALEAIAEADDAYVLYNIVTDDRTTTDLLMRILRIPNLPMDISIEISKKWNVGEDVIHELAIRNERNVKVLHQLANHKYLGYQTYVWLCSHPDSELRYRLASRVDGYLDALLALVNDEDIQVRKALVRRQVTTPELMFELFKQEVLWKEFLIFSSGTTYLAEAAADNFTEFKNFIMKKAKADNIDYMPINWIFRTYGLYASQGTYDNQKAGRRT